MPIELERKFHVPSASVVRQLMTMASKETLYDTAYSLNKELTFEVTKLGAQGELTIFSRSKKTPNDVWKFRVPIPGNEARELAELVNAGKKAKTRVRLDTLGKKAVFTIKFKDEDGNGKPEYEYLVPYDLGIKMYVDCSPAYIVKTRYLLPTTFEVDGKPVQANLELDVFHDKFAGCIVVEIEHTEAMGITVAQFKALKMPEWVGKEVTNVKGWSNRKMVKTGVIPTI